MRRFVLITNLDSVNIGAVRTFTNALLLVDDGSKAIGPRYRARGFHNEPGCPTFDVALPSIDYELVPEPIPEWMTKMGGTVNSPMNRGGTMSFAATKTSPAVSLELCADIGNELGLDVERWEGEDKDGRLIMRVWDQLPRKVIRYYHAPFIMLHEQHSATAVAAALEVERVCR